MTTTPPIIPTPRRRWPQFSLQTLMALVLVIGCGLGVLVAYSDDAQTDGDIYFTACACGFKHATIADGKVVLAEPNHDTPLESELNVSHQHPKQPYFGGGRRSHWAALRDGSHFMSPQGFPSRPILP